VVLGLVDHFSASVWYFLVGATNVHRGELAVKAHRLAASGASPKCRAPEPPELTPTLLESSSSSEPPATPVLRERLHRFASQRYLEKARPPKLVRVGGLKGNRFYRIPLSERGQPHYLAKNTLALVSDRDLALVEQLACQTVANMSHGEGAMLAPEVAEVPLKLEVSAGSEGGGACAGGAAAGSSGGSRAGVAPRRSPKRSRDEEGEESDGTLEVIPPLPGVGGGAAVGGPSFGGAVGGAGSGGSGGGDSTLAQILASLNVLTNNSCKLEQSVTVMSHTVHGVQQQLNTQGKTLLEMQQELKSQSARLTALETGAPPAPQPAAATVPRMPEGPHQPPPRAPEHPQQLQAGASVASNSAGAWLGATASVPPAAAAAASSARPCRRICCSNTTLGQKLCEHEHSLHIVCSHPRKMPLQLVLLPVLPHVFQT
jgi:hypothetical protein